jgi:hypothetical protein
LATTAQVSIAYIEYYDDFSGGDFQEFLEMNGYAVSRIQLCDVPDYDLTMYDLLIIGQDTGDYGHWGNDASVGLIRSLGLPILGLFYGGGALFNEIGLELSSMNTATNDDPGLDTVFVPTPFHAVFEGPRPIDVDAQGQVTLYDEPTPAIALYMPVLTVDVVGLGIIPDDIDYSVLGLEGNAFLWGFKWSPFDMTDAGKDLFLNVIDYLLLGNP